MTTDEEKNVLSRVARKCWSIRQDLRAVRNGRYVTMPLFKCSECASMDNTALTNWAVRRMFDQAPLCSACDPEIRQWHDEFPRVPWNEAQHGPHDIERMMGPRSGGQQGRPERGVRVDPVDGNG